MIRKKINYTPVSQVDITAALQPEITPKRNVFYISFPLDIYVKVNAYGRTVKSVIAGKRKMFFSKEPYPYEEDAWIVKISAESLTTLPDGEQLVAINFNSGEAGLLNLQVVPKRKPAELTITAPDVNHGNSVLFLLPDGKKMLVDCGKAFIRDSVIIPLLKKNGVSHLDYLILSHYHEDHDSGDRGQTIREKFKVDNFRDYRDFKAGDEFEIGGVHYRKSNHSYRNAWRNINRFCLVSELSKPA